MSDDPIENKIVMYGIWICGADYDGPVALFTDPENASEWASQMYYGRWLRFEHEIDMPLLPETPKEKGEQ